MGTKITWFGHSAFRIETSDHTILIDPFINGNPLSAYKADALEADFILVSHGHGDHVGDAVDIAKRTGATVVANPEVAHWIGNQGVKNISTPNTGGSGHYAFGSVQLTLAFHSSSLPDGSYGGSPNGLFITLNNGKKIYHAGDTALFSDMQLIGEKGIDLAIVPIGDFFTMGIEDSIRAIQWLKPRYVMPCHYNTFPPITQDAARWASLVSQNTLSSGIVLDPGGTYDF